MEEKTREVREYERGEKRIIVKVSVDDARDVLFFGIGAFTLRVSTPQGAIAETQELPFPILEGNRDRAFRMFDKYYDEFVEELNDKVQKKQEKSAIIVLPAGLRIPKEEGVKA